MHWLRLLLEMTHLPMPDSMPTTISNLTSYHQDSAQPGCQQTMAQSSWETLFSGFELFQGYFRAMWEAKQQK